MQCCKQYPLNSDCPRGPRGERGEQGDLGPGGLGTQGAVGPSGDTGAPSEYFGDFFVSGEPGTIYTTAEIDGLTVPVTGSVISEGFSAGLFTSSGTGEFTYIGTEPTSYISVGLTMNFTILNFDVDDTNFFHFTLVLLRNGVATDAASTHEWNFEYHDNEIGTMSVDAIIPNNTGDVYSLGMEGIYNDAGFGAVIDVDDPLIEITSYSYSAHVIV